MAKLIIKFTILGIPLLLLIAICLVVGRDVGETYPLSRVAQLQAEDRETRYDLIGTSTKHMQYKYESILVQEPQLLLMGSSRGWYFREHIANRCPASFFNASYGNSSIFEMANMLQKIINNGGNPEVILLGIDYPDFNGDSDYRGVVRQIDEVSEWDYFVDSSKRTIIQVLLHPETILDALRNPRTGSQLGWGFVISGDPNFYTGDGSYYEKKFTQDYLPIGLEIHHAMIERGELQYEVGSTIDANALQALETLLQLATDNDIEIIGFFPPIHEEIRDKLGSNPDYAYIPIAHRKIISIFDSSQFPIYDFSNPEAVSGHEEGMYDGWHSGELLSTQIYLQLLNDEAVILSKYSDVEVLENMIDNSDNSFTVDIDRSELHEVNHCE